jgi:hypothetical protein
VENNVLYYVKEKGFGFRLSSALGEKVKPARLAWQWCLMLAAFFMLGCGLSDYEQLMLKSQSYMENKDREEQILGSPLAPPPKVSAEGQKTGQPAVDLYIRAPRGISGQYDSSQISEIMWRYPAVSGVPNNPFIAMYLAVSTTMDHDQFWQEIQQPFMAVDMGDITKVTETPFDGPPLEYECISRTVEDRPVSRSFFMYVYRGDLPDGKVARVAVIFQTPENAGTGQAAQEAMKTCLKTLVVGSGASNRANRMRSK